jgi:hypothetical protein
MSNSFATDPSNLTFTRVQDTVYDAKLLQGLADLGILPRSFQMFVAYVDVAPLVVGSGVLPVYDAKKMAALPPTTSAAYADALADAQIVLPTGSMVCLIRGGLSEALAVEADLTAFQIGLSLTSTGALVDALSTSATGATLGATTGTGLLIGTNENGGVVGVNRFLTATYTVANADTTTGIVKLTLVIV